MNNDNQIRLRKFNPGTGQTDREIIDQFVVRERELKSVLDVLRENIDAPSNQHLLLVAPRGRGKTMLLERVAAELRTDDGLSQKLLPVRFMEESHEVFNIAEFWLECLLYLANAITRIEPERAVGLKRTRDSLAAEMNNDALEHRARAAVLDTADAIGRKLVLMVENLQDLNEDTDDDFGWQLRKTLQTEDSIILLGTATSRFKALDEVELPFFELFRIIYLEPLTTEQCARLWRVVSGDDVTPRQLTPLKILTGGSPRLLVIVAEFARHRSIRQLMEELVTLIDEHTEYFRSHLDAFAKTERRVYLAVIDLWQASTTGEIAKRARMDVRNTSSLLGRLVGRGAVLVEGSGRAKRYSAAERLYSIYYKLRKERDEAAVVKNLVRFMTAFYNPPEFTQLSRQLMEDCRESDGIREGLKQLMAESAEARHFLMPAMSLADYRSMTDEKEADRHWVHEVNQHIVDAIVTENYNAVVDYTNRIISDIDAEDNNLGQLEVARALVDKGNAQAMLNDLETALETCDEAVRRFGTSEHSDVQIEVAWALFHKGTVRAQLNRPGGAIETFNTLMQRFDTSQDESIRTAIFFSRAEQLKARLALRQLDRALEDFRQVYEGFVVGSEYGLPMVQRSGVALVRSGISSREVLDILLQDPEKSNALQPLIVALSQELGEKVRAPAEVLEVAIDIRAELDTRRKHKTV